MLSKEQRLNLSVSILNCIEKAITPRFGENAYRVIIANFETRFALNKNDIASNSEKFEKLLDDIFGTGEASQLMKRCIFKELANHFQFLEADYFGSDKEREKILSRAIGEIIKNAG